ncbi:methylated-DNA--[protein]-cysteine S-methyltransferase [Candidatus Protochlamydia phocaeensis]|uniref:methylated-DNA--[protein]-cysteine S-methyltransferase n=1 Tax=Candidatus Protochlamydia phocaeensis TaxID=1414722 RepID=UPI000838C6FF|nr:MGMT family protein [Candidatus Protochlamydia phocaeensis]
MSNEEMLIENKWSFGPPIDIDFHVGEGSITSIALSLGKQGMTWRVWGNQSNKRLEERIEAWLSQYGRGKQPDVAIPLDMAKMPVFTYRALEAIRAIPFGTTLSYGQVAQIISHPQAARAIGSACRRNPFPLIIPCHRVLDSQQQLRGYSAGEGLKLKRCLLDFEGIS